MATSRTEQRGGAEPVLQAWEECREASPGERGLILLRIAAPALSAADCAALSVGRRDSLLLDLFRRLFGDTAPALVTCPGCRDELEFDVPLTGIAVTPPTDLPDHYTLRCDGREIAYRLPCAGDLAALGAEAGREVLDAAVRSLVQRCVLAMPADLAWGHDLAGALEAAIAARVAEHDPQAAVTLDFDCPTCGAHWSMPFDIVEFLWRRLDVFASALLRDVHVLASNYGWSEGEIAALSPRRRHYIELIGA